MAEPFFSQTDGGALLALLERTALRDAALITVSAARRVENCSRHAAGLTGLRPLDPVDRRLRRCATASRGKARAACGRSWTASNTALS